MVEQAIALAVTRLDQDAPRLWTADAIDVEPASLLERADTRFSSFAEDARGVGRGVDTDAREPGLQVADRLAGMASAQERAYRNSCNS